MFTAVKWVKGRPYLYRLEGVWDKKKKCPKTRFVEYLGKATPEDVRRYYKGEKYNDRTGTEKEISGDSHAKGVRPGELPQKPK